jgi:hypothetical protein
MTERVDEILSWYEMADRTTRQNLRRILMHGRTGGTGKLVVLPVDQGFEHGPARSFAANPPATTRDITPSWHWTQDAAPMRCRSEPASWSHRNTQHNCR